MYVIYNRKDRTYATRKTFTPDFCDSRIYKKREHAENAARLKFHKFMDDLAVIPLRMTLDPRDEFTALIGGLSVEIKK